MCKLWAIEATQAALKIFELSLISIVLTFDNPK